QRKDGAGLRPVCAGRPGDRQEGEEQRVQPGMAVPPKKKEEWRGKLAATRDNVRRKNGNAVQDNDTDV
ncbi:MAG TPA: hypothetical protein VE077_10800, partial [Candidatus Methylomirabilis sp.]|nr:hypothetical protein [Candidatus Methylomirabilis sp.]